jgi:hypothetical protein
MKEGALLRVGRLGTLDFFLNPELLKTNGLPLILRELLCIGNITTFMKKKELPFVFSYFKQNIIG